MEFWKSHNKLKGQKSYGRSILYSESGQVLCTDEEQGRAFLARFVSQSSHNDHDCRMVLRNQIEEMVKMSEPMQCFNIEKVRDVIRTSRTKTGLQKLSKA